MPRPRYAIARSGRVRRTTYGAWCDKRGKCRPRPKDGPHWLRLLLPGQALCGAKQMTSIEHDRGHFSEQLHKNTLSILVPGIALLKTRDSFKSAGTGTRLIVITTGGRGPK
jgi:hypothetical protein